MKLKYFIPLFFLILLASCSQDEAHHSQTDTPAPDSLSPMMVDTSYLNQTSSTIHQIYREPCFASEKLNKLLNALNGEHFFNRSKISEADFNSLNATEHFIHSFYYPEAYYQVCAVVEYKINDYQTIEPFLERSNRGVGTSQRQREILETHRDSTLLLMDQCIRQSELVSGKIKEFIVNMEAFELIPTLITTLENQTEVKDNYILTTFCLLMKDEYEPFIQSDIFPRLYPTDSTGRYFHRPDEQEKIRFNKRNHDLIVGFALGFYQQKINQPSEFVKISGGEFRIGEKKNATNPPRTAEVNPFEISRYEITNKQFKQFVRETRYYTLAEKNKDAMVFRFGLDEFEWFQDSTASWKYPNGVAYGGIEAKMSHPVTCISYVDALAYCEWANVRLPTLEEWEVASRGGNFTDAHYFGDQPKLIHDHANIWQGKSHFREYEEDDYMTTSPVGTYKPNPFGLHDMYGNVFEYCSNLPKVIEGEEHLAAARGGSWWCSFHACGYFNSSDIGWVDERASFSNNGFRVVLR